MHYTIQNLFLFTLHSCRWYKSVESLWMCCAISTIPLEIFFIGRVAIILFRHTYAIAAAKNNVSVSPSSRNVGYIDTNSSIDLHTCLAFSRPGLSLLAKKIKVSVRSVIHYRQTQRWLAYWNSTPAHRDLAISTPKLLQKIYRPYQSLRLCRKDRLNVLMNHYDFIFRQGLNCLVLQATKSPVLLGEFRGKYGTLYEMYLSAIDGLDREGELTLNLCCDQRSLFSIAFTFYSIDSTWNVGIGCLQGPRGIDARDRVRHATRDMFGLRPKALLVRMVREIGGSYECKNAILVGNKNRVMTQIRTGKLLADYDGFWEEIDAMRRPDGDYQISCKDILTQNPTDLPSHKRSERRKRISLTEHVVETVLAGFFDHSGT